MLRSRFRCSAVAVPVAVAFALLSPLAGAQAPMKGDLSARTVTDESNARGEPIDLSPTIEPGVKASYEHWLLIVQRRQMRYQDQINIDKSALAEMRRRFQIEVLEERDDGTRVVALRMQRIRWRAEPQRGFPYAYDTRGQAAEGPMPPSQARMLDALADLELRFAVSPDGAEVEILNPEAIEEAVGEDIRAQTLGQLFTPDWCRATMQEIFCVAFDKPERRLGEVWTRLSLTDVGGLPDRSTMLAYEFESYNEEERLARIVGAGRFNMDEDETFNFEGGPARVEDQTLSFEQYFDAELGRTRGHQVVGGLRIRRLDMIEGAEALALISSEARMVMVDPDSDDFADVPFREAIGVPEDPDEAGREGRTGEKPPGGGTDDGGGSSDENR